MIGDDTLLTYIFLGFVAVLFVMLLWSVSGGPRKPRPKRRPFAGGTASDSTGGSDPGPLLRPRRRRDSGEDRHDDGGGDDGGGGDSGGGD